jgi:hypothetical protein
MARKYDHLIRVCVFVKGFFEIGSHKLFACADFKLGYF